jgi:hypothetical protein
MQQYLIVITVPWTIIKAKEDTSIGFIGGRQIYPVSQAKLLLCPSKKDGARIIILIIKHNIAQWLDARLIDSSHRLSIIGLIR